MTDETRSWPAGLRQLAELIGPAAAVKLADEFGGTERNYIPKTAHDGHPFAAVIGLDRLAALCAAFGGTEIDIPNGTFKDLKKTQILDAEGSSREIARRLRVTQRYVRRVRNQLAADDEPDLFTPPK